MLEKQGVMLEKNLTIRNGLRMRVGEEFLVNVIMLLVKKRERQLFCFAGMRRTASAERLVFSPIPKNHANIITVQLW